MLKLNETPVRTARNFNINNIKIIGRVIRASVESAFE